ncbi:cbb3-type cytochrome c oxidase subunit II [Verrucomicrobia bacterium]|nr:cbb3-type cytochrome c oxidase subunit II [Verrucomicrobiota bacterium]
MKHAPYVFVGVLACMASTFWFSIFLPHMQLGVQQPHQPKMGAAYPGKRAGEAAQGADVYRANGCVYCHSQQVNQTGVQFDVVLKKAFPGPAMVQALKYANPTLEDKAAEVILKNLPMMIASGVDMAAAELIELQLKRGDENMEMAKIIKPLGADIERGWGMRRSVALDYLYEHPVQLGSVRLGPDLANVGGRLPLAEWHLKHLYYPAALVSASTMPDYPFLFETVSADSNKADKAINFTAGELEALPESRRPAAGEVVVPRKDAETLVAYLLSLNSSASVPSAPMPPLPKKAKPAETNAAPAVAILLK